MRKGEGESALFRGSAWRGRVLKLLRFGMRSKMDRLEGSKMP